MSEKVAQNPEPAIDQVWDVAHMDAPFVIERIVEYEGASRAESGYLTVGTRYLKAECRCIGLVTPHGRVMVGERRQSSKWVVRVSSVWITDHVRLCYDDGADGGALPASTVASWPLISPPSPAEPQTWGTLTIGGVSYPAKEIRYEAEGGEEAASTRVILGTRGNVAFTMTLAPEEVANARRLSNMIDPREQGPGISRLPPPEARPDVVVTAVWEDRWTTP